MNLSLNSGESAGRTQMEGRVVRMAPDGAAILLTGTDLDGHIAPRDMMMDASRDPCAVKEGF